MCLLMELPRNMLFNVVFHWQCLVLGTILYLLYTSPLSDIVKKFNLSYHFYADDSHLYLTFQPTITGDRDLAVSNIERCVLEIDHRMLVNRLKLNKDKTELLVISAASTCINCSRNLCRQWDHLLLHTKLEMLVSLLTIVFFSMIILPVFANHLFIIFVISAI